MQLCLRNRDFFRQIPGMKEQIAEGKAARGMNLLVAPLLHARHSACQAETGVDQSAQLSAGREREEIFGLPQIDSASNICIEIRVRDGGLDQEAGIKRITPHLNVKLVEIDDGIVQITAGIADRQI